MTLRETIDEFDGAEQYAGDYRIGITENAEGGYDVYAAKGLMPPHFTRHHETLDAALADLENSFDIDHAGWQEPQF